MFKFHCPHCQQKISAEPEQSGQTLKCPACSVDFVIPSPTKTEIVAPPSEEKPKEAISFSEIQPEQIRQSEPSPETAPKHSYLETDTTTEDPARSMRKSVSMKAVLLACWREAFDSGFVPFVVHGIKDACKTMLEFARKPYATLVRFSNADNQEECKSLLASSVSLFIGVYWIVDKIVGSYAEVFQEFLNGRLESGLYLSSDKGEEVALQMTQVAQQFAGMFGSITQQLELGTVFLLLGLIFTTYYLFRRKAAIDPSFHDEDTSRFIRPTLLFACGNGMIVSLIMLISPFLMISLYLGIFGFIVIILYFLVIGIYANYALWGYIKWLSHYFSVSKKRAVVTYIIVGGLFNILVQIIHFLVVLGPVMLVDTLLG